MELAGGREHGHGITMAWSQGKLADEWRRKAVLRGEQRGSVGSSFANDTRGTPDPTTWKPPNLGVARNTITETVFMPRDQVEFLYDVWTGF